jgi:hypothetical protein
VKDPDLDATLAALADPTRRQVSPAPPGAAARRRARCIVVSVDVEVDPDAAFDVFTSEIDAWYRRGPYTTHGSRRPGTSVTITP